MTMCHYAQNYNFRLENEGNYIYKCFLNLEWMSFYEMKLVIIFPQVQKNSAPYID